MAAVKQLSSAWTNLSSVSHVGKDIELLTRVRTSVKKAVYLCAVRQEALKPLNKVRVIDCRYTRVGPLCKSKATEYQETRFGRFLGFKSRFSMLTFTPLSGAAKSSRTSPLAYLLQVDDINILLDCGSPDWCPEPTSSENGGEGTTENNFPWEGYCDHLKECVMSSTMRYVVKLNFRRHTGLPLQSISFFFRMEIFHIPDCTLTRTRSGVSKLRRILLCPFKPWPA